MLTTILLLFLLIGVVQSVVGHPRRLLPNHVDDGVRRAVEVPVAADPKEHLVTDLPLATPEVNAMEMYSGLLPASPDGDKYLFYWLFAPDLSDFEGNPDDIPLLLWLNGGPGCSSMDGLFIEHGPIQLKPKGKRDWEIIPREHSWHKAPAYVVYLDQPVGTGLSFTTSKKYPKNDKEVNQDFYYWLVQFFKLHKNLFLSDDQKSLKRPFFFSGESHAGHYIPSMIAYILNQNKQKTEIHMDVTGAAIGNGWVDPYHQYSAATAAYGYGIIGNAQKNALDQKEKECQQELRSGHYHANVCFHLLDAILADSMGKKSSYKVSQYDVRVVESKRGSRQFPPGHKNIEAYLGGHPVTTGDPHMTAPLFQVMQALHVRPSRDAGQVYQECTDPPYFALSHQDGLGVVPEVIQCLEEGVQMLFFNGITDLICNHVGNEVTLENMAWSHQYDWIKAPRYAWQGPSKGGVAGYMKEYKNLLFLKVLNSGHMVPLDVPEISLDMMRTFMQGKSFDTYEQNLARSEVSLSASSPLPPPPPPTPSPTEPPTPPPTGAPTPSPASTANRSDSVECPVCPDCLYIESNKNNNSGSRGDNAVMEFVVAHSWLGAILAVVLFFIGYTCCGRNNEGGGKPAPILYREMEMQHTNGFKDVPDTHYRDYHVDDDEGGNEQTREKHSLLVV